MRSESGNIKMIVVAQKLSGPVRLYRALLGALCCVLFWYVPAANAAPPHAPLHEPSHAPQMQTQVSGKITTDTQWTKEGSPYQVTGLLTVELGVTLTLEPGVEVLVAEHTHFIVHGSLIAEGTQAEPIRFSGSTKQPGWWYGISAGYSADAMSTLSFNHVIVEYAGYSSLYDGGALVLTHAHAVIRNSRFQASNSNGLSLRLDSELQLEDTVFIDNQLNAIRVTSGPFAPSFKNLTATGNGRNAIVLNSVDWQAGELVLPQAGLPYAALGGFSIKKEGNLVIEPGVEIAVETGFYMYGGLSAIGTAEQPILITGLEKTRGSWWGLNIIGDSKSLATAHLEHVIIEYGGESNWDYSANLSLSYAQVTLHQATIRFGGKHAIVNRGGSSELPGSLEIEETAIVDNSGAVIFCNDTACGQSINALTATGNDLNALVFNMDQSGDVTWQNVGLPYVMQGYTGIYSGMLTIEPGVEIRMSKNAVFAVSGTLKAIGTPDAPIRFTGLEAEPGWWQGIRVYEDAVLELSHCEVGYGGAVNWGMVELYTGAALINRCLLHHSAGAAVQTSSNAAPSLLFNRFEHNAAGVVNSTGGVNPQSIDARYNWWGDPSGPTHSSNPGGKGQSVSDRVLYEPWLLSPDDSGEATALEVRIGGVGRYSPGDVVQYAVSYANPTGETVGNAVLRFILPATANYMDSTGDGLFWPERREVFWRLGDLAPGATGLLAVRVVYGWGLPDGLRTAMVAQLAGDRVDDSQFDLEFYRSYTPRLQTGRADLTPAQVQGLRTANPALDAVYRQAEAGGYFFGNAYTRSYNTGETATEIILLRVVNQDLEAFLLYPQTDNAVGLAIDGRGVSIHKPGKVMRYDLQTKSWHEPASSAGYGIAGMVDVAGVNSVQSIGWSQCMLNCIEDKLPGEVIDALISALSTVKKGIDCYKAARGDESAVLGCSKVIEAAVPVYGVGVELGLCNVDCENCEKRGRGCEDDDCHCCKKDSYRCNSNDWLYGTFGVDVIMRRPCRNGMYLAEVVHQTCALCDKCVMGGGGPICMAKNRLATVWGQKSAEPIVHGILPAHAELALVSSGSAQECEECLQAKDPNEIIGPAGDLLPGELVTYMINYENVGQGIAYDVFVENPLSEHFDLSTLTVHDDIEFSLSPQTRMLFFDVGNLMPTGVPGATGSVSYSLRLKSDLPSGTVVTNQAVVHFPSVPEETPTNTAVNVIQPVVVMPRQLQVTAGESLAIVLQGQDAAGAALEYSIVEVPRYGTLSGTPPNLNYLPNAAFAGLDRLLFVAGNGVMTSRPAEIRIQVLPNPNDSDAPAVLWTAPASGGTVSTSQLVRSTAEGELYSPYLQIQFSEAVAAHTVTEQNIQVKDETGRLVPVSVAYVPTLDQAVLLLREQGQQNMTYTVTVKQSIADLRGNAMAADHVWQFRIGDTIGAAAPLYVPMVQR